jgi:hypothetical protein
VCEVAIRLRQCYIRECVHRINEASASGQKWREANGEKPMVRMFELRKLVYMAANTHSQVHQLATFRTRSTMVVNL